MCPRIGGRRDRPNSLRTLLLQLSGLDYILSSVLDLREDRAGRTATHGRAQSTSQAGHEMNSLLDAGTSEPLHAPVEMATSSM